MLTVKVYIDRSPVHGVGVFAAEDIKKDTLMWIYVEGFDRIFTQKEFEAFPKQAQDYISRYSYKQNNLHYMDGDNCIFMNHSDEPNMADLPNDINCVATRDIKKGEELTINYNVFDEVREAGGDFSSNPFAWDGENVCDAPPELENNKE